MSSVTSPDLPTREILWNVGSLPNVIIMYALFGLALLIALAGIVRHVDLWRSGQKARAPVPCLQEGIANFFSWVALQRGVVKARWAGLMHTLIYLGFLTLLFTTTMVFIHHDLGFEIYQGTFYLGVTVFSDVLGLGLLVGCLLAAHRRYVQRADLVHNRVADGVLLGCLALLVVQGFILEGLRIHVTDDPWAYFSPVGLAVARFFWPLSSDASKALHFGVWWFHTITVFAALALVPYTKFFHIVASSVNLYFRDRNRPKGQLHSPGDMAALIEKGEEFSIGLGSIKDYSWKELLDLDACTSCGRCQDACPAYRSGKPLSPKWLILDSRNHALTLQAGGHLAAQTHVPQPFVALDRALNEQVLFPSLGLLKQDGSRHYVYENDFRSKNELVNTAAREIGKGADQRIAEEVIDPMVFWSCTTCYACVNACPVGINHVDQIMGNRRNLALMHGDVPSEAQTTLRALENRANPYGAPSDRIKWLEGLNVSILKPGDSVDYLYWVGCVSAYDPRKQKIAQALVKIMNHAGLCFGILGTHEGCSGDPARRLGEENLFQTLAKSNMEVLKSIRFKVLVANCPHCFNTIKHEYPQFGNLGEGQKPEVIHHSVLLKRLIDQKKITLQDREEGQTTYTFHDPCYLGRYNDEYDAPRDSLRSVSSLRILEMEESRDSTMCCGAGGGHFWMDIKLGKRVNVLRVKQASESGAQNIATACPFCMQMLEDGVKLTDEAASMQVRDIAEVLAEQLV